MIFQGFAGTPGHPTGPSTPGVGVHSFLYRPGQLLLLEPGSNRWKGLPLVRRCETQVPHLVHGADIVLMYSLIFPTLVLKMWPKIKSDGDAQCTDSTVSICQGPCLGTQPCRVLAHWAELDCGSLGSCKPLRSLMVHFTGGKLKSLWTSPLSLALNWLGLTDSGLCQYEGLRPLEAMERTLGRCLEQPSL